MITFKDLNPDLISTIVNGSKHANYDKTVELQTLYRQLITGEDIDKLMRMIDSRESPEQFKERKKVTEQITKSVCKNLMDVAFKVPRSTSIQKTITTIGSQEDNTTKVQELQDILGKFYGDKSFDVFCSDKFIRLNYIDPNSFIVMNWKEFKNNEKAQPYPLVYGSDVCINYSYDNNLLQWLILKLPLPDSKTKWIHYGEDTFQILEQVDSKVVASRSKNTIVEVNGISYILLDNDLVYKITIPANPYNLGSVPAFRVGFLESDAFPGVFETPITAAIPFLKKSIKVVSEMDITMTKHAFPQKVAYVSPCHICKGDGKALTGDSVCENCGGTGQEVHTSALDMITLKLPRDPSQPLADLSKLIFYHYPPVEGVKFQKEYIDYLTEQCRRVVFNSDIYDKKQVSGTATGKNIDLQNVYDSLYPFAMHYSEFWKWGVQMVANITDIQGITASMKFGKDFKFQTLEDRLSDLDQAKKAGASIEIINLIEDEIMRITYEDTPELWKQYQIRKSFMPFRDKTVQETLALISSLPLDNYYRVLWSWFDLIFRDVATTNPNFYLIKERPQQEEVIKLIVAKYTPVVTPAIIAEIPKMVASRAS